MSLLQVQNLSKGFDLQGGVLQRRVGRVQALKNVSFELEAGDALGIVGESGSGKSTLARLITRTYGADEGEILWEGEAIEKFTSRQWATQVQMVFQDPTASLNPKLSVRTLLEEALSVRGVKEGALEEMHGLLEAVGLPVDILMNYPHQFSGGQKQRLAIARALSLRPRLLVADEPVSALDLSIQAQILNLLMELKKRYDLTTIVISHDLAVVAHLTNKVLVLNNGEIVEMGETKKILSNPQHPYTQILLDSIPQLFR